MAEIITKNKASGDPTKNIPLFLEKEPSMNMKSMIPRIYYGVLVMDNIIYIIGGLNYKTKLPISTIYYMNLTKIHGNILTWHKYDSLFEITYGGYPVSNAITTVIRSNNRAYLFNNYKWWGNKSNSFQPPPGVGIAPIPLNKSTNLVNYWLVEPPLINTFIHLTNILTIENTSPINFLTTYCDPSFVDVSGNLNIDCDPGVGCCNNKCCPSNNCCPGIVSQDVSWQTPQRSGSATPVPSICCTKGTTCESGKCCIAAFDKSMEFQSCCPELILDDATRFPLDWRNKAKLVAPTNKCVPLPKCEGGLHAGSLCDPLKSPSPCSATLPPGNKRSVSPGHCNVGLVDDIQASVIPQSPAPSHVPVSKINIGMIIGIIVGIIILIIGIRMTPALKK